MIYFAPCLGLFSSTVHFFVRVLYRSDYETMAVIQTPTPSFFIYSPFLFRQNFLNSSFFFISFFALKVSYSRENQHMGGIVIRLIPPSAIWHFDYILVYQTLPLT
jgi:hypothetical protein